MARSYNFVEEFNRNNFNLKKYVLEKRAVVLSDRQIANSLGMGLGWLRALLNELGAPQEAEIEKVEKETPRVTIIDKENKQTKVDKKKEPYVPVEMKIEKKAPEMTEIE